jgi:hypothetical protein
MVYDHAPGPMKLVAVATLAENASGVNVGEKLIVFLVDLREHQIARGAELAELALGVRLLCDLGAPLQLEEP